MGEHFDARETRSAEERAAALARALPAQVAAVQAHTAYGAEALAGVDPRAVRTPHDLAGLPVLRKAELVERQEATPPFGGLCPLDTPDLRRVFQSPGPIHEPQSRRADFWRFARAMVAAGFRRAGGLVHNSFAYHFTPAGFMFDDAAAALDCPVFPAGTGQTEQQVRAMAHLRPRYYTGTPSFLNILLEKADELGVTLDSLSHGLVTAEPLPPSLVERFRGRGIEVHQCYGTADLGLIAYETEAREGLVVDEDVLVEIVRPGTGEPVAEGEVGEVVVTTLDPDYPLLRFATGDLSAVLPGPCPSGRTHLRIRGWMGRADQTAKVRGLFVTPGQVAEVRRRHPGLGRVRLVITQEAHRDCLTLQAEADAAAGEGLGEALAGSLREVCGLRGEVSLLAPGTLPNDGRVIDDRRTFD